VALESGQGVLNEVGVAVVKGQPDKAVNASTAPRGGQLGDGDASASKPPQPPELSIQPLWVNGDSIRIIAIWRHRVVHQRREPVEHQRTSQFACRGLTLRNKAVRILNVDDRTVSTCEHELAVDTAE
jgi:hypothetical protein